MNTTHSGNGLKYVVKHINKYLILAEKFNGFAYGEFVKDVMVKVINCDFSETTFTKVNVWFKTDEDKMDFVKEVLFRNPFAKDDDHPHMYNDVSFKHMLEIKDKYDDIMAYFDLKVEDEFPNSGYDILNLMLIPTTCKIICHGSSLSLARKNMIDRKALLLDIDSQGFIGCEADVDMSIRFKHRTCSKILEKGYTILIYEEGELKEAILHVDKIRMSDIKYFNPIVHGKWEFKTICAENEALKQVSK